MATGQKNRPHRTFDANLELKDAGVLGASAACQVGGSAAYIDVGTGFFDGEVSIDVSAIEIASNDEYYQIAVEGASETAFDTTCTQLASLTLGALEAIPPGSSHYKVDSSVGRYFIPFSNEHNGTYFRYIRLYVTVAGTIATGGGINFTAYAAKRPAIAP
jgi:hypothetical protein